MLQAHGSKFRTPGEDGFELIARIRAKDVAIPVIALTAYAGPEDRKQVLSAGFQMLAPKPIEPAEIVAMIAGLTGRATSSAGSH